MQPVERIEVGNALGECVLWDDRDGTLWWTDIEGRQIFRLNWVSRELRRIPLPERLAAFCLIEGDRRLVAAFESRFALFDPDTGRMDHLLYPDGLGTGMRLNDGRVDRRGRFWVGAMVEAKGALPQACLYRMAHGEAHICERGVAVSNGIAWSPDEAWFYFADSLKQTIWRYAFDSAAGIISNRRVFARTSGSELPDGAAVDNEGHLWVALWGGGCVVRYDPEGHIERVIEVPTLKPTCVAFGGPELDLLFVTTARVGLQADELARQTGAGDVFVYNAGVRGLQESRFKLEDRENLWRG